MLPLRGRHVPLWQAEAAGACVLCCFGEVPLLQLAQEREGREAYQARHLVLKPAARQDKTIEKPKLPSKCGSRTPQLSVVWFSQNLVQAKEGNNPRR